ARTCEAALEEGSAHQRAVEISDVRLRGNAKRLGSTISVTGFRSAPPAVSRLLLRGVLRLDFMQPRREPGVRKVSWTVRRSSTPGRRTGHLSGPGNCVCCTRATRGTGARDMGAGTRGGRMATERKGHRRSGVGHDG